MRPILAEYIFHWEGFVYKAVSHVGFSRSPCIERSELLLSTEPHARPADAEGRHWVTIWRQWEGRRPGEAGGLCRPHSFPSCSVNAVTAHHRGCSKMQERLNHGPKVCISKVASEGQKSPENTVLLSQETIRYGPARERTLYWALTMCQALYPFSSVCSNFYRTSPVYKDNIR